MTAHPVLVAERLANFVCAWRLADPGEGTLHAAKRLLLNQLKASAEASQQPSGLRLLLQAARSAGSKDRRAGAHLWWSGLRAVPEQAAAINGHLLSLLDLGDTHLPSLGHFSAGLLPSLLAQAETGHQDGTRVLTAFAVGLEVGITAAQMMSAPQHVAEAIDLGAVAARCTLRGIDRATTAGALGELCARWPVTASAGADAVLDGLGQRWRLSEIAMHCRPLPVVALAPVDAVLALRPLAGRRTLLRLRLSLSPQAHALVLPGDETLRNGMAAAWSFGQFSTEESLAACRDHPSTLALRERIELHPDERLAGIEACVLSAEFTDGSRECTEVSAFLGSAGQPLSDSQLSELFRSAADDLVLPRRSGEILQALWGLDRAADVGSLLSLLCRPG